MSPQINLSPSIIVLVRSFSYSSKKLTNTEIGTRTQVLVVTNLTMWFRSVWSFLELVGGILRCLAVQARNALDYCKGSLMANSGGSSEDQNANRTMDSEDRAQVGSEEE